MLKIVRRINLKRFILFIMLIPTIGFVATAPMMIYSEQERCEIVNAANKATEEITRDLRVLKTLTDNHDKSELEKVKKVIEAQNAASEKENCVPRSFATLFSETFLNFWFILQLVVEILFLAFLIEAIYYLRKNKKPILE